MCIWKDKKKEKKRRRFHEFIREDSIKKEIASLEKDKSRKKTRNGMLKTKFL